ncbi:MAG: arylsulfatase [Luteolibacter sp.]
MKRFLLSPAFLLSASAMFFSVAHAAETSPNIIVILADDLGYGDVQRLNPERGKIATPHMDQLAAEGMVFTDAHTCSSVCTPTRYGLMTGRYNWRSKLQKGVLYGFGTPLIPQDRLTVPALLKKQGYNTAMIGKWHLGLDLPTTGGEAINEKGLTNVDWNGTIGGGPADLGFDYFFGISASLDMPPYVYIENRKFLGEGTVLKSFPRKGVAEKDFEAVDVLDKLTEKTLGFIAEQKEGTPFFAYMPLPSPHTPIVPTEEWKGKSEVGRYGDFVMQTDAVIGKVVDAIDAAGFGDNTLIIVTSDNGCSKAAGIGALEKKGHYPSAQFRGSKADLWDGGHRVPFIVRWPAQIDPGSESEALICLTDLMASAAEVADTEIPAGAGEDSVSFVPAFTGGQIVSSREGIIHHSIDGNFAYRQGKWKLLLAKGSGGWTSPTEKQMPKSSPKAQLYDMEADPGETQNLYESHPEVAARLLAQLESDVAAGRSTDGAPASNDVDDIKLWK